MMFPDRCPKPRAPGSQVRYNAAVPPSLRRQAGSMVLEAMVGILVSAALGLGMAYSAARALKTQRYVSTQTLAVLQMRALLAVPTDVNTWCNTGSGSLTLALNNVTSDGAIAGSGASTSTVDYSLTCSVLTPTITGAGQSASVSLKRPTALSTIDSSGSASSLFGGDGVIRFGP